MLKDTSKDALKEYIFVPMSKSIVLPYETGKFLISSSFTDLFTIGAKVILGFYSKIENDKSIVVVNSLDEDDKTNPIIINRYGCLVQILNTKEIDSENLEVTVHGLTRTLITSGVCIDYKIYIKGQEFIPKIPNDAYKEFNDLRLSICDIMQGKQESTSRDFNLYHLLSLEPVKFLYYVSGEVSDHDFTFKTEQLQEDNIINGLKNIYSKYFHYNKKFKEDVENAVYEKFKKSIEDHQKNYLLNEQMKTIKGEIDKLNPNSEVNLEEEINKRTGIPETIKTTLLREYDKIRNASPLSSEYSVVKNYINIALSLPWDKSTPISHLSLKESEQIINEEHYGLEDVKENILQYLATAFKTQQQKMKVLLLQGPPGVGKTSIGSVLAKCLKREFVFISLTSIEIADLCGHRRTYVGAYPGRIINSLIEAGVNNPLFFLDEVDKMNKTAFNNPLNVLVALLDPTQNNKFTDQFLSFPFDLSKCIFVLTANSLENIPDYLVSRMEIINLDGYTLKEKVEIGSRFLLPKIYQEFSLTEKDLKFEKQAMEYVIKHYTREMGVRKLQQLLNTIVSKVIYLNMKAEESNLEPVPKAKGTKKKQAAKSDEEVAEANTSVAKTEVEKITVVDSAKIKEFLANVPIDFNFELHSCESIGMAWTSVGGDILKIQALFINSGKGDVIVTGNLGQVMKESVQVAFSLLKNSPILQKINIPDNFFNTHSLHIHVPEGAVPKDGPSAGITIYTAIMSSVISAVTGKPYTVPKIAMTGEISLSFPGEVLAIGGLKQKILAAVNYGINEVIVPYENKTHIEKIQNFLGKEVKINFAKYISDVEKIMFKEFI